MEDRNAKTQLHFVMFPLLAQGHINPFLELSKALATHGHKVSFISTPVNISRLRPSLHVQEWPGQIDLLALPLPPTEGLTPGAECMADIPPEMWAALCKAIDGMEKPFESLLGELSSDYLIQDHHHYWTRTVAEEMHIPVIYFAVLSPVFCCHAFHPCKLRNQEITAEELGAPPPGFPSSVITLSPYEARDLLYMYRSIPGHVSPIYRLGKCLEGCVAIIVRSCFESEDKYIRYLHDAIGVPVFSVGPLMPTVQSGADGTEESELLKWLDRWGSVMESLSFGIPLIFLPLQYDHGLNARLISAELKAGIEIETADDGSFLREKISKTLVIAMSGGEGEKWRSNAAKACDNIAANKQSYVRDFIQKLENLAEDYKN